MFFPESVSLSYNRHLFPFISDIRFADLMKKNQMQSTVATLSITYIE